MRTRPERLDAFVGTDLVGAVHDSAPLAFRYAPEVQAFFENLRPEGELRDYLAAQRKASTLFSLPLEVASDTAGAFVLVAPGQTPEAPRYEATSWKAIAAALGKRSASAIDIHEQGARISLAGRRTGQDQPGDRRRRCATAVHERLAYDPHPRAQHPSPGQGRALGRMPAAIEQATQEIAPALAPSARTLAERRERFVSSATEQLAARLTA